MRPWHFPWLRSAVAALGAAALLAGCGGGGGGGGGTGGTPFADTASAYWVSATGSRWVYQRVDRRSGHDTAPVLKTVVDAGEQTIDGAAYRRFEHSWSLFEDAPETEYRRFDGRSILNAADLAGEFGLSLPAQTYAEVPAPLVDGQTVTLAEQSASVDLNGDGRADSVRLVAQATIGRTASLSVAAGDFVDLLRVRTVITGTVTDGATGLSASASATLTAWYAPGIGIVKRIYEDPGFSAPENTVTEELVGIDAGGHRAGLLPGLTLLDDIGAGTDSSTPAATSIAMAGDRLIAVATRGATVQAAIRRFDGTLVWGGTVLQAPDGHEFGSVTASFDGNGFRVVGAHRRPFDSPAVTAVVAQRVGIDGTLADGASGSPLDTGIADATQTLGALRSAARDGRLLVAWGRFDTTYVPVGPGLVTQRGYVTEARLFDVANAPLAASLEVADGLPAAIGERDDQFMVTTMPQVNGGTALGVRAVSAVDGLPVGTAATAIDARLLARTEPAFHRVGTELWLAWGSYDPAAGTAAPSLTLARLGRDGALLDGTPAAPGRELVSTDAARGFGRVALGGASNLLAWTEGWDGLNGVPFDADVLTGSAPLSAQPMPLVVGDPLHAVGPSRSLLWSGAAGNGLAVVWLDNLQSAGTPSDRVMATLMLPRLTAP